MVILLSARESFAYRFKTFGMQIENAFEVQFMIFQNQNSLYSMGAKSAWMQLLIKLRFLSAVFMHFELIIYVCILLVKNQLFINKWVGINSFILSINSKTLLLTYFIDKVVHFYTYINVSWGQRRKNTYISCIL